MQPLRFQPVFQRYLWGGRRLATVLNKPIGDGDCAESWELADHHQFQSVVRAGDWAGRTLAELMKEQGRGVIGQKAFDQMHRPQVPPSLRGRFPLLLKFLDAQRDLSVQVHPDDALAATLDPPDFGKTEAWYVIDAEPESRIYAGLKRGVGPAELAAAIERGQADQMLHSFSPRPGDCLLIRAGTIHAIGAGCLIAEIQQASNTTFRLYDWNRVDSDGQPRPLHIEPGIQATNFSLGPVDPIRCGDGLEGTSDRLLVQCEQFVMRRRSIDQPVRIGGDSRFHILAVLQGAMEVEDDPVKKPLAIGDTLLIPAASRPLAIVPDPTARFLQIGLPE